MLNKRIVNKNQMQEPESEHASLMFNTFFQIWNTGCRSHRVQVEQVMWQIRSGESSPGCCWTGETAGSVSRKIACSSDSVSTKQLHWVTLIPPGTWTDVNSPVLGLSSAKLPVGAESRRINGNVVQLWAAAVRKFIHDKTNDSIYLKTFEDLWELQ